MTGKIIHAELEFRDDVDAIPSDPEAVAIVAREAFLRTRTDRELLVEIGTDVAAIRHAVAAIRADLSGQIDFCRSSRAACNQVMAIPAPPAGGRSRKMDWRNRVLQLVAFIVAASIYIAAKYADPSAQPFLYVLAGTVVGLPITIPGLGGGTPPKPPSVPPVVGVLLLVLGSLMLQTGCAGSLEEARLAGNAYRPAVQATGQTPIGVNCVSLDRSHVAWDAVAKASGALAGSGGLAMIPVYGDKGARTALIAGIVGASAVAVLSDVVSQGFSAEWARFCAGTE